MVQLGIPHDVLLGRWRLTLDLFGRVFVDDVGAEPGSIISELGGFPVKETKFRREMERLRTSKTVDLTLHKLDRDRNQLIVQVNKENNDICTVKSLDWATHLSGLCIAAMHCLDR